MDGTVIPLEDTAQHRNAVREFRERMESREDVALAYVTGRHLELALEGIRLHGLGTSLYTRDGDGYREDASYSAAMQAAMGEVDPGALRASLAEMAELNLQADDRQGRFKLSFTFDPEVDLPALLSDAEERIAELGGRATLVTSRDTLSNRGLLDVLPVGVAKDHAVRFLRRLSGLPEDRLIYAGDSGNDRAAMLGGYRVVVVGNAPEALKSSLLEEARDRALDDRIYIARRPYAAGVLEGLAFFGVE